LHLDGPRGGAPCGRVVIHEIECRHQIEVEVWPARAEVYFRDERFVNPANTQVRFDSVVYNAPTGRVTWEVRNLAGGPGAGSIDSSGLYVAPLKGTHPHGLTDLVAATSVDDPFRKAYGLISLIGFGPAPVPLPTIEIFPKQAYIYFSTGHHNAYIDTSNKEQRFRAFIRHLPPVVAPDVKWFVGSDINPKPTGTPSIFFLLQSTDPDIVGRSTTVTAQLASNAEVTDTAIVYLLNYDWPGIVI
jgi:hypothetical protein